MIKFTEMSASKLTGVAGLAAAICIYSTASFAGVAEGIVSKSSCVLLSKEDTTTETMVGGALGGAIGSGLGSSLFGKSGSVLGGLAGAALGGAAGSSGEEAYKCVLVLDDGSIVTAITGRRHVKGESLSYAVGADGIASIFE